MSYTKGEILCREDMTYPEGALVFDGDAEDGSLLAHPMGGGVQFVIPQRERCRFLVMRPIQQATAFYRPGHFSLADNEEVFEGWSNGEKWNGWGKPFFGREVCKEILAQVRNPAARYDAKSDAFITINQDGEEEIWPIQVLTLVDGNRATAYPLGAGSWTWEAA